MNMNLLCLLSGARAHTHTLRGSIFKLT